MSDVGISFPLWFGAGILLLYTLPFTTAPLAGLAIACFGSAVSQPADFSNGGSAEPFSARNFDRNHKLRHGGGVEPKRPLPTGASAGAGETRRRDDPEQSIRQAAAVRARFCAGGCGGQ